MLDQIVRSKLCIACGACAGMSAHDVEFVEQHGMPLPCLEQLSDCAHLIKYCPGKGYDIVRIGRELFGDDANYDMEIGYYRQFCAARAIDPQVAANASSGGVITAVLLHLLETGLIQGALVTKFIYGDDGPFPMSYIASTKSELLEAQGSKYCPVTTLSALRTLHEFPGKIAWIGTPCQIAGLRMIQEDNPVLREKIPFTIANFCGGFRDNREARRLASLCGVKFQNIKNFRYRGDGQPGFMRIETTDGECHKLPYPDYARWTGFSKLKRCRLCVDAMGELADFSCGDAWLPRFLNTGIPWSILMARSETASNILQEMKTAKSIIVEGISVDELKRSQHDNLQSKKTRQHARRRLFSFLKIRMPVYDGGYKNIAGGFLRELRIHCQYLVFSFLERLRLYQFVAALLGRYR